MSGVFMSRMKDYLFLLCRERDNVLDRLSDERMADRPEIFNGVGQQTPPSEEFDESFPQCGLYVLFTVQLQNVMEVAHFNNTHDFKRIVYSMVYSHAVTLLESFISQSLTALAERYDELLIGLASHYDAKKREKMTLMDVVVHPGGIKGKIKKNLSDDLFHNPETIRTIFFDMFGEDGKGVDIGKLAPIIKRRHDIVHRNGTSVNGSVLRIELDMLNSDIKHIQELALDLNERITNAVLKLF
jgi:hypothetical protein